jgi:hypothetical protein
MTEAMAETMTEDAVFELLSLECHVDEYGYVRYLNALGELHRVHGPAVEYSDGRREWYQNGLRHRPDGPAVVCPSGYLAWWQNDLLHRLGGPAIVYRDGSREWFQNGQQHRVDGPAFVHADGGCEWYIKGRELTRAEWQKAVASMENV